MHSSFPQTLKGTAITNNQVCVRLPEALKSIHEITLSNLCAQQKSNTYTRPRLLFQSVPCSTCPLIRNRATRPNPQKRAQAEKCIVGLPPKKCQQKVSLAAFPSNPHVLDFTQLRLKQLVDS